MRRLVAVVFDWAGTVIDFGCLAPVSALQAAMAQEGVTVSEAQVRADMGRAKRDHVAALLQSPLVAQAWLSAKGVPATDADVDRIYEALVPLMKTAAAAHTQLIDGADRVAAQLRASGIKVGGCTGYTREMMAEILPRAAEQGYAPAVTVCAGETAQGRPTPLMLWSVLTQLEAWPVRACVKVDDAPVGIQEGVAAGVWTVGVSASGNEVGLSAAALAALPSDDRQDHIDHAARALAGAGADFIIPTVADLPGVLQQIEARIAGGLNPGQGASL